MAVAGYLECAVELDDKHLNLGADCVGVNVPFTFRRKNYQILFPKFDFAQLDVFDHPTATAKGTKIKLNWLEHRSELREYGSEHRRNTTDVLGFSANTLIVRSSKPITSAQARRAKKDLIDWREAFTDWFEAIEYTDMEYGGVDTDQEKTVSAYFLPVGTKKSRRIKQKNAHSLAITVQMSEDLELRRLRRVLRQTATGKRPPTYYKQLISALRYYHNHEYRQTVLDVATATELAMTQMLDDKLSGRPAPQRRKLLKKYRQLSGLELGLTTLGVAVPSGISTNIGRPRNAAMHRGMEITSPVAQTALHEAKAFIYSKLPIK